MPSAAYFHFAASDGRGALISDATSLIKADSMITGIMYNRHVQAFRVLGTDLESSCYVPDPGLSSHQYHGSRHRT